MTTTYKESKSPSKKLPVNKLAGGGVQEQRRVTFALSEALELVDFSRKEVLLIEQSIKKLQDAIHGLSLVFGHHGAHEVTSNLDAELAELYENLTTSSSVLDTTCTHMKKSLDRGKKTFISYKRALNTSSSSFPSTVSTNEPRTWSPSPIKQTIPNLPATDILSSSSDATATTTPSSSPTKTSSSSISLHPKSIGATTSTSPLKADRLSPVTGFFKSKSAPHVSLDTLLDMESSCRHTNEVNLASIGSRRSICTGGNSNPFTEHFSRNGGLLHGSKAIAAIMQQPETEQFETAEQTLAMAKLLHDLATAESEAKQGSKISIRPLDTRSKEFTKVYLNTSKELLLKETTGYFAS